MMEISKCRLFIPWWSTRVPPPPLPPTPRAGNSHRPHHARWRGRCRSEQSWGQTWSHILQCRCQDTLHRSECQWCEFHPAMLLWSTTSYLWFLQTINKLSQIILDWHNLALCDFNDPPQEVLDTVVEDSPGDALVVGFIANGEGEGAGLINVRSSNCFTWRALLHWTCVNLAVSPHIGDHSSRGVHLGSTPGCWRISVGALVILNILVGEWKDTVLPFLFSHTINWSFINNLALCKACSHS